MMTHSPDRLFPTVVLPLFTLLAAAALPSVSHAQTPEIEAELATWQAVVQPGRRVEITAPLDGILAEIQVTEGQTVEAGELLASMDDTVVAAEVAAATLQAESTAAIERAEAVSNAANIRLERVQRSHDRGGASADELSEAEADATAAAADVALAQQQQQLDQARLVLSQARLDEHRIAAPFTGVITELLVEPGAALRQADRPAMILMQLDPLEAEIPVPTSVGAPQVGEVYELVADSPVNAVIRARCVYVNPELDAGAQAFRCTFEIENADGELPANFRVHLRSLVPVTQTAQADPGE